MRELKDEIALQELRAEQHFIHLESLSPGSADAVAARANLDTVIHRIGLLKVELNRLSQHLSDASRASSFQH